MELVLKASGAALFSRLPVFCIRLPRLRLRFPSSTRESGTATDKSALFFVAVITHKPPNALSQSRHPAWMLS